MLAVRTHGVDSPGEKKCPFCKLASRSGSTLTLGAMGGGDKQSGSNGGRGTFFRPYRNARSGGKECPLQMWRRRLWCRGGLGRICHHSEAMPVCVHRPIWRMPSRSPGLMLQSSFRHCSPNTLKRIRPVVILCGQFLVQVRPLSLADCRSAATETQVIILQTSLLVLHHSELAVQCFAWGRHDPFNFGKVAQVSGLKPQQKLGTGSFGLYTASVTLPHFTHVIVPK